MKSKLAIPILVLLLGIFGGVINIWGAPTGSDEADNAKGCLCLDRVGNVDCDYTDQVDMGDMQVLIDHLFISLQALPSREEANCDGDPACNIDMGDLTALIDHLFISLADLPLCPQPPNAPPETMLPWLLQDTLFINATEAAGSAVGVSLTWSGEDLIDHPYYPPPFEFEWKLFGPYSAEQTAVLADSFMVPVFVRYDYEVFRFGEGAFFEWCDTSYYGGIQEIRCDTVLVDTIMQSSDLGMVDTVFRVLDSDFVNSADFYLVADSSYDNVTGSIYVTETSDLLYDVYRNAPSDTTRQMTFVFWVRSRDPIDSTLFDPTPAFATFEVIDAKHERDVLVVDWAKRACINRGIYDSAITYWTDAVDAWGLTRPGDGISFDTTRDFVSAYDYRYSSDWLRKLLSYRIAVLLSDDVQSGLFAYHTDEIVEDVYTAIRAGVNTWLTMRCGIGPISQAQPATTITPQYDYRMLFGAESIRYSGWTYFVRIVSDTLRIEDFIGAYSANTDLWPDLVIDSALLHRRYTWPNPYGWIDTLAALPEVNWCVRNSEAEVMYTYQSLYGDDHPLGADFSYEGRSVMHRMDFGFYRTVYALFSPMAFEQTTAREMVNSVLDWLYEGRSRK